MPDDLGPCPLGWRDARCGRFGPCGCEPRPAVARQDQACAMCGRTIRHEVDCPLDNATGLVHPELPARQDQGAEDGERRLAWFTDDELTAELLRRCAPAGQVPPGRPDDPDAIAARIAALACDLNVEVPAIVLRERLEALADDLDGFVAARGTPAKGSFDDALNMAQAAAATEIRRALRDQL